MICRGPANPYEANTRTSCGSCTVLVNGAPVQSCRIKAAALQGKEITTIEGLSPDGSHPVQRAWHDEDVPQCGQRIGSPRSLLRVGCDDTPPQEKSWRPPNLSPL